MSLVSEANRTDDIPEGMHVMIELDRSGDTKIIWDPNNADEVENARLNFERLTGEKKMLAYAVDRKGNKAERVRTFDSTAEKLIFAPATVGG